MNRLQWGHGELAVDDVNPLQLPCLNTRKPYRLPSDAVDTLKREFKPGYQFAHREIVNEWSSESFGTFFRLIAYRTNKYEP